MRRRVWKVLAFSLACLLVLQLVALAAWWLPVFGGGRMQIIAHHGDVAHWPEDTIEAITAAAGSAADGVEIDVQTSADGTWWVFHDPGLARLTDGEGMFADLTDAEVARLRVVGGMGSSVAPMATYRVPLLSSVMEALSGYSGTLILDVKVTATSDYEELARRFGDRDPIFICQTAEGALAVKRVNPTLRTAASPGVQPRDGIDYRLLDVRTRIRSPFDLWLGDPVMLYENGADYGNEDPEWFRRAEAWGAEMYLTNDIERAIEMRGD